MREQEFKARDKTVNKMSRDGLVEENLQKKDSVRVSQRELDNLTLPGQAADSIHFQREKAYSNGNRQKEGNLSGVENSTKAGRQQRQSAKKRLLRETQEKNATLEPIEDKVDGLSVHPLPEKHTYFAQEPDSGGDVEPEVPEAGSVRGLSEHFSRMGSIRGHPSGGRNYVEAVVETSHSRKKKLVQSHFQKENGQQAGGEDGNRDSVKKNDRYRETPGDAGETLDSVRENIKKKQKWEQIHKHGTRGRRGDQ